MACRHAVLTFGWATLALGAALSAGGCGGSTSGAVTSAPQKGDVFGDGGVVLGAPCVGDVYAVGTTGGYAVCADGVWEYATSVPCGFGGCGLYTGDAGDDASPLDATGPPG
jgi:hypothetical protein